MNRNEATARTKIDELLRACGWIFPKNNNDDSNISFEFNIPLKDGSLKKADYLLFDNKKKPLCVIEAKSKNPLNGKEQARDYADALRAPFVILSDGEMHFLWDIQNENPQKITNFPTQKELLNKKESINKIKPSNNLPDIEIKKDFIVNPDTGHELRYYQVDALKALQQKFSEGKTKFLFEMATGTGKTFLCAGIIKLFLDTGNAKRVLFLVDRLELENQTKKAFDDYFKDSRIVEIYKNNKNSWEKADILISTVQSFFKDNKYKKIFKPTDFDLVVADEVHRSIGKSGRDVFEFFHDGYKVGLTATPKDYLKNIDISKLSDKDPRALEERYYRDTYETFDCHERSPTFQYSLEQGVHDNFLVKTHAIDARTKITTELFTEEGLKILKTNNETGDIEEKIYKKTHFEKKFFSDKTNTTFCQTFLNNAKKDPISKEIGKTIIFCVSQKHATKIVQILNKLALKKWPDKYDSDFAIQLSSNVTHAQQYAKQFKYNILRGKTKWLEEYNSSKARVCVTVDMMTTGYDCPDLLNVCFFKPTFSPTLFIQMKGRGTRKHIFKYTNERHEVIKKEKDNFYLFDYFANCEYFDKEFPYDKEIDLPKEKESKISEEVFKLKDDFDEYHNQHTDPLISIERINRKSLRVDYEIFGEKIQKEVALKSLMKNGDRKKVQTYLEENYLNKAEKYFTEEKLKKGCEEKEGISIPKNSTLYEILEHILFQKPIPANEKEMEVEQNIDLFFELNSYKDDKKEQITSLLRDSLFDEQIKNIIINKEFAKLFMVPGISIGDIEGLGTKTLSTVIDFLKSRSQNV